MALVFRFPPTKRWRFYPWRHLAADSIILNLSKKRILHISNQDQRFRPRPKWFENMSALTRAWTAFLVRIVPVGTVELSVAPEAAVYAFAEIALVLGPRIAH